MFPLPSDANNSVFSPTVVRLGEIQWHFLHAANLLESRTTRDVPVRGSGFVRPERTEFGDEVGKDEISWWVFKKENDLGELRSRTERTLNAMQTVKLHADGLRGGRHDSYDAVLNEVRTFIDGHETQINEL